MIRADDGSTAFPARVSVDRDDSNTMRPYQFDNNGFETPGMSLRDHFAGLAMQGLICDPHPQCSLPSEVAETAYLMADAMLKARKA